MSREALVVESEEAHAVQPLEWLPRRRQIQLMRGLARAALAAYDLPVARLTLLKHRYNTGFRVDASDGQRYVLRINRAGTPTVESVGAELEWLRAIRRDTALEAPDPVPTRDGSLLTVAETPELLAAGVQPHVCVLFRWLGGRMVNAGLLPAHLRLAGELMARLENHAAAWGPPHPLARGRVDAPMEAARRLPDPFAPEVVAACRALVASTLSDAEAEVVAAVIERVREAEEVLRQSPEAFGLMHADLHNHNLLFDCGAARALDFDDCGFGPLLYDLAVMLAELQERPSYPSFRAALLEGYRRARPLTPAEEANLDTFIALRRVQDALWVLGARRHPAIGADWRAQARRRMAPLASFLTEGGRFSASG